MIPPIEIWHQLLHLLIFHLIGLIAEDSDSTRVALSDLADSFGVSRDKNTGSAVRTNLKDVIYGI